MSQITNVHALVYRAHSASVMADFFYAVLRAPEAARLPIPRGECVEMLRMFEELRPLLTHTGVDNFDSYCVAMDCVDWVEGERAREEELIALSNCFGNALSGKEYNISALLRLTTLFQNLSERGEKEFSLELRKCLTLCPTLH